MHAYSDADAYTQIAHKRFAPKFLDTYLWAVLYFWAVLYVNVSDIKVVY